MCPAIVSGMVTGELKQRRFWATQVNRKWIFQIVSMRVKTLSNTNLLASSHIIKEEALLPVDVRHSKTPFLLTNNRPLPGSKNPQISKWGQVHNPSCENEFYLHENENLLHIKGWALNVVLIQRRGETRNKPIGQLLFPVSNNSPRSLSESFLGPVSSRF